MSDSDPMKGICTANTSKLDDGITNTAINGKSIGMKDEACDNFLDKKKVDRAQMLKKGF
ncbi:MAG: hypothetical protein WA118_10370 [Carboxydocellales bacterium]